MLSALQISNYVLINSLNIEFDDSLNIITGETGAGKSIILGALSLILGGRADTSVLLDKSQKCVVEATFDISSLNIQSFFDENDWDYAEMTIIRREITEKGKSRAFVNDTPVALAQLKNLTTQLIDIHSQHSNLLFHNADFRVQVVDEFAQTQWFLTDFQEKLAAYEQKQAEWAQLLEKQKENIEKKDYFDFVFHELQQANLRENEQEELENEIDFLTHTETIKTNLFHSLQLFSESDDSLLEKLRQIKNLNASISSYHTDLKEISKRLESSYLELKDLQGEITALYDRVDYSPELLAEKKERLDLLYHLEQKYHLKSVGELIAKRDELETLLNNFSTDDEKIVSLQAERDELYQIAWDAAHKLSDLRRASIVELQHSVVAKIEELGIQDGRFEVKVIPGTSLHKNGIDEVQFWFSANKGVPVAELEKVASGGEISRLMLAVKATISDKSILPTIVFDEIDVGISGEVANKVGRVMKTMSHHRQLLVITHLPQIAAQATSHYKVYKETINGLNQTKVRLLDRGNRIQEIAQMMRGDSCSEVTLKAAEELINE